MKTLEEITNIETWKKINPKLSITSSPFTELSADFEINDKDADRCVQQVIEEGHFCTKPLIPENEAKIIAEAVEKIVSMGLPAAFIYLYDETWQIFKRLSKVMEPVLGKDYKITIAGMWAWHIAKDGEGFPHHRDMFAKNFLEDGRPEHLTVWIPFTDVTTLSSCMHVLPTNLDPHFPDDLHTIEIKNYSHIRALPAKAGSILAWNANIVHWGSKASKWSEKPRISIAMDFSRADADMDAESLSYAGGPDDLNSNFGKELTFEQRLNAIGEAIAFYKARIPKLYPEQSDMLFELANKYYLSAPIGEVEANEEEKETRETSSTEIDNQEINEEADNQEINEKTENDNVVQINCAENTELIPAKKCAIQDCDGQGFGVYATEKISAKELIEECHLMPAITKDDFDSCSTAFPIESFSYQTKSGENEQVVALGFANTYRHSTKSNAVWLQHETVRAFQFYALEDIEPGEEIRINYFLGKSVVKELVPPTKITVQQSPNKGLGVFATEDIYEGEVLEDCMLQHLGGELSRSNAFTHYRFNHPKRVDSLKRVLALGQGGVFNHDNNNNAYWIDHPQIKNVFRFIATRNISKGEEVCTSYGDADYWEEQDVLPV